MRGGSQAQALPHLIPGPCLGGPRPQRHHCVPPLDGNHGAQGAAEGPSGAPGRPAPAPGDSLRLLRARPDSTSSATCCAAYVPLGGAPGLGPRRVPRLPSAAQLLRAELRASAVSPLNSSAAAASPARRPAGCTPPARPANLSCPTLAVRELTSRPGGCPFSRSWQKLQRTFSPSAALSSTVFSEQGGAGHSASPQPAGLGYGACQVRAPVWGRAGTRERPEHHQAGA